MGERGAAAPLNLLMKVLLDKIIGFIKTETVLSAATVLALLSMLFIPPDAGYIDYIDIRTLGLLFCLMAVMAGFRRTGVFTFLAERLLLRIHSIRGLAFLLVMLCFFSSMLITNDVALLTFVPFTFVIFSLIDTHGRARLLIRVVAMETVAANLGSMLTPLGNPQNLYLYGISGMGAGEFVLLMLPYTVAAFIMLAVWAVLRNKKDRVRISLRGETSLGSGKRIVVNIVLFILCLLTVARVLDWRITLFAVIVMEAVSDRGIFKEVDYTLLITFIAFFVFIGNMGRLPAVRDALSGFITGRECVTGVISSQVISNVPAALLLSGFTNKLRPLIVGVNLGGLGTLIASMASLISFKLIGARSKRMRGRYFVYFTAVNIIFLVVLLGIYLFIQ